MFNFWKLKGNFRDEKENLIAKNTVIEKKIEHRGTCYLLNSVTYQKESVG